MKFHKPVSRLVLLSLLTSPTAKALADSGNPFDLASQVATDWTGYIKTMAISAAGLGAVVVICLAMFGYLRIRWAFQIAGGLIALATIPWIISALQGQGH